MKDLKTTPVQVADAEQTTALVNNVSLQKAKEPNRFKIIHVEQYSPSQACITIKTSDGKFYSINFDKSTTCSCPFSDIQTHIRQGEVPCKHRLFVLVAIGFSEEDEKLYSIRN